MTRFPTPVAPALLAATAALLTGCASDPVESIDYGDHGDSQLEPTFAPEGEKPRRHHQPSGTGSPTGGADGSGGSHAGAGSGSGDGGSSDGATTPDGGPDDPTEAPAGPVTARVADDSGDVSSFGDAPSYVDIVATTLTRDGSAYELVVEFAGTVPLAAEGDTTTNVAGFFDVDGDGQVDYEVWGNLADDGWYPSYRHPDGADFNEDSGVTVSASGRTLVFGFRASQLGSADAFRWSVGAEHGTFTQLAAGTMSKDQAPDDNGAAAFPG